jgi:hypothetical protein|tara:strand:- start:11771 stop:12139 length:369 start_codon:yes stop_codon:yes gene_type:complete
MMADNRVYPSNTDEQKNVAATLAGVGKASLVRGSHFGVEDANGVQGSGPETFDGYTPLHIIDEPSDGINDGAKYVTYFQKDSSDPAEFYKATDADVTTLAQLTSGAEYDLVSPKELNRDGTE